MDTYELRNFCGHEHLRELDSMLGSERFDMPDGSTVTMADGCVLTLRRSGGGAPCPTCGTERGVVMHWDLRMEADSTLTATRT